MRLNNALTIAACLCGFILLNVGGISEAAKAKRGPIIPNGFAYPPEHIYDTLQYSDEALVNVQVESNRWPHCQTFETAIQSIFRIEGVTDGFDEEKALALWKWTRMLMSNTGRGYAFEGNGPGKEKLVFDGHKILTVYGHHQCDGLSWAMASMWRAAGYIAFDEASHGHTTASLRYQDYDGIRRFHSFDLRERFFWWNPQSNVVGTRTLPLMRNTVLRHLTLPQKVHSLRTSLHQNETLERRWKNIGHVIPYSRRPAKKIEFNNYSRHQIGRKDGIYSSAGMEIQKFSPDLSPTGYKKDLYPLSGNIQILSRDQGKNVLHPAVSGQKAEAVYRIYSPYAAVNATVGMTYRLSGNKDRIKLFLSRDKAHWQPIFEAEKTGEHHVEIDLGRKKRNLARPNIYTAYTFFLKIGMTASQRVEDVGVTDFSIKVYRSLNKRTLPNLLPGDNTFRVSADHIMPGKALALAVNYQVKGQDYTEQHVIGTFPYYFNIRVNDAEYDIRDRYDKVFDLGDIRMKSISMQLINASVNKKNTGSALNPAQGEKAFNISSPHPVGKGLFKKRIMTSPALGIARADGFFPQKDGAHYNGENRKAHVAELIKTLKTGKDSSPATWRAAEALGGFPEALDALLKELPSANIDLTLFICKALARIPSPEAIEPLLKKWEQAPSGSPGTRYIPDVLAAIGNPKVVPYLTKKLKHVRFDFRIHIARALGILGGKQAREALQDLAADDPFPAVRQMAEAALSQL